MLPGGVIIRSAAMRGVESQGMLCSASELGLSDDASGLLVLDADSSVGVICAHALDLDDAVLTLKLTPNRADCLSILGLAREVAAITGAPLPSPADSARRRDIEARRRGVRVDGSASVPALLRLA